LVTAGVDGALNTWRLDDWSASFRDRRRQGGEFRTPRDERTLVYGLPRGEFVGIAADPDIWLDRACAIARRGLRGKEWTAVLGSRTYDPACTQGVPTVAR
jgi:hypothetical protein